MLRFFCLWDDDSLYGARRPYTLHYYLADDTVEILQVNEPNSGRDPFPLLLKRGKLPRKAPSLIASGPTGKVAGDFVKAEELKLGSTLNVYNRNFLIYDCDEFTKYYITTVFGHAYTPVDVEPHLPPPRVPELPPHNGFGSLRDTQQNCLQLIPQPPKRDVAKLMNFEKVVLRFTAKMAESDNYVLSPSDASREFILSYFVSDDTLSVFEPPQRNSGIVGGKFLERCEVMHAGSHTPVRQNDLCIGTTLTIFNRKFNLVNADEYTLNYMEANPDMFPSSDVDAVVAQAKQSIPGNEDAVRSAFIETDVDGTGSLGVAELEAALRKAGLALNPQQVLTLARSLDKDKSGSVSVEEILAVFGLSAKGGEPAPAE